MQIRALRPSRRTLWLLVVLLTLAPVGTGLVQVFDLDKARPAATISDLAADYEGFVWSNRLTELQTFPITLVVTSRARTRFTGTFTIAGQSIPVTGNVSNAGRVTASGSANEGGINLRATAAGQLSAGGEAIVGTYSISGRVDSSRFTDRGTAVLTDEPFP